MVRAADVRVPRDRHGQHMAGKGRAFPCSVVTRHPLGRSPDSVERRDGRISRADAAWERLA